MEYKIHHENAEMLAWNLMKFCKGYKLNEIKIYGTREDTLFSSNLIDWEGNTKAEKIKTLVDALKYEVYDGVDIILPNYHTFSIEH